MRARTVAAFTMGFAAGALALALAFHFTSETEPLPGPNHAAPQPETVRRETRSGGPVAPYAAGDANRFMLPPPLAMPLAGIDPAALRDTYHDQRDGHEHEALDIAAPRGTPVRAVADGQVVKLFNSKPGGLTVYQFDHSRNWCFYYAHLDAYAAGLTEGAYLRTGNVLGYVGSTGNASPDAPHLHFALFQLGPERHWWKDTRPVDPFPLLVAGR